MHIRCLDPDWYLLEHIYAELFTEAFGRRQQRLHVTRIAEQFVAILNSLLVLNMRERARLNDQRRRLKPAHHLPHHGPAHHHGVGLGVWVGGGKLRLELRGLGHGDRLVEGHLTGVGVGIWSDLCAVRWRWFD